MSKPRIETITCPQCGKETEITIWESLNAQLNPEENQKLLDGTLFQYVCVCGYAANINAAMLYHNMTHKTMVYYVDEESVDQTDSMLTDIRTHIDYEMDGYIYRVVTSQNALREKASILDCGLDDRVIELVKLFYYAYAHEQHPEEIIDEILFFIEDEKWMLQFLGSASMVADLPVEFYEKIRDRYALPLKEVGNEELHVNMRWALEFKEKADKFLFDETRKNSDRVHRITVKYRCVSRQRIESNSDKTDEYRILDYTEHMILDRENATIEYSRNLGDDCIVAQKLYIKRAVEELLDQIDSEMLLGKTKEDVDHFGDNLQEAREYVITFDFEKGSQRVIQGTFDRNGLPEFWSDFASDVCEVIKYYVLGDILNPKVYQKVKHDEADYDYIYCSVAFAEGGKTYYYRAREEDDIEVGDRVEVPVGEWGHETTATVVDVEYFLEDEVPLPVERTKYIIRKSEEDSD